ncbi:glycosyltransferase family 4 protein [Emticicia sp. TH156]|uniref:glycosyltransferase family 4 protein n=1 Tax=Emticicia sp. TH156 TaxID=2067454 RepID=UPI000C77B879|nr:MraY family glycosyltransferase [Emticicia sp. TH156]PLK43011.1 undecaprenyl/decaprenyl-phosphate alpha-N-acetylglucosaminyl 1-phosphate transferase [Emticicia sp. TH156]
MFPTFESLIPDKNIQVLISALIALFINLRSIPVIINISGLRGLMDNPVKRSSHSAPTPTFGGVAIFAGILIGYMLWNFGDEGILLHKVFAGITILFFLGIKDDLYALSPTKKLGIQIIASAIVVVGCDLRISDLFGIFGIGQIPYLLSIGLTIFIFVAMINAFNLIDGIDGLAGGIGMIAGGGFGLWFLINHHYSLACLALCLSGSLLGFLRFNFSKSSKIFMGDTGSLIVGYIITVLAVKFIHFNVMHQWDPTSAFVSAPIIAVVILVVPIFDTIRVFSVRILRGKSPFKADRMHMHHLLIDNNLSHMQASFILYAVTIVLTVLTYSARVYFSNTELCFFIMFLLVCYFFTANWLEVRRLRALQAKKQKENTVEAKLIEKPNGSDTDPKPAGGKIAGKEKLELREISAN